MIRMAVPPRAAAPGRPLKAALCLLGLLVFSIRPVAAAGAPDALAAWRSEAASARALMENDVQRAYTAALRLQLQLPAAASAADQVQALNLLARAETIMAHIEQAEHHARLALDQAARAGDRLGQAEAELSMVIVSVNQGKIDAMLSASKHAVELLRGGDRPDLLGEALLRMSMMYRRYDMYDESMAMAMQAMDIARTTSNPQALAYAHQGVALINRYAGRDKEASEQYLRMLEQARAVPSKLLEAEALNGIAAQLDALGDLPGATARAREGLALLRAVGAPLLQNSSLYALGSYLHKQGRYDQAQPMYDEMLDICTRYGSTIGQWYALSGRSENLQSLGLLAAARADAGRAHALARQLGLPLYLAESTRRAAAFAAIGGDPARAYALVLEADGIAAKAQGEKIGRHMVELAQHYRQDSERHAIDELTLRNRKQLDEIQLRKLEQRWLWTTVGGSCALLAGAANFVFRLRRSRREIRRLNTDLEGRVRERTAKLRQQTRYMRSLFDLLPVWVWLKDTEGRYLSINQPNADAYGQTVDAIVGRSDRDLGPRARADQLRADEVAVMATRERKIVEREELLPGAVEPTWMQTYHAPVLDEDGTLLGTVGMARDIGDSKREQRMGASRARAFERLAQGAGTDELLALVVDYVETASPALRCTIALRDGGAEAGGMAGADGADEGGDAAAPDWRMPIRDAGGQVLAQFAVRRALRGAPTAAERELLRHGANLAAIVIEHKRIEAQLQRQAAYDALTGLPNRRMFGDRLREEIIRAGRSGEQVAVLFIDLDLFKEVNDALGHHIGDRLLQDVARRISQCVRASDVVARLGGDEFVVILPAFAEVAQLHRVAQQILDAVSLPLQLDAHTVYVSASIGIAVYPDDADNLEQLVVYADRAMYAAKDAGRNSFRYFTLSMHQEAQSRLQLTNELRHALARGQLQVWLQPIVDLASGRPVKAEALLRWQHPQHGAVPPDVFIPIAEEIGIIAEIGDWVLRQAVACASHWRALLAHEAGGPARCQVSVNVSPRQFVHGDISATWLDILAEYDVPAHCLAIEITEGLLLNDHAATLDKLARLRAAGMQLALDDFGTGYSAMAYLKKFNIDYLKIDRSFVRDLETDANDKAIVEAIVVMARKLGVRTIAEGVETATQRDLLASFGCDFVQGYWYAKPMPAQAFFHWLRGGAGPL